LNTELLISCDDWENRVAVLEEGSLSEIYFEREEKVIGSIYKGRVENVLPGMGACFVNIGLGRNAFLYVDDIRRDPINIGETEITDRRKGHTVNELLKVGDEVLVQIVKEPRGLKGARVSTNISLPGRYLVLMPTGRYSGVSSRIEDDRERERLKQVMRRVRPEGMATIVRTAARGVSEAELIADLGVQLRLWHGILESYKRSSAPALLHKDLNLVFKAVRDFMTSDVRQVVIDSKGQYDEIRSTMSLLGPQYLDRLKLWEGQGDLFEARGVNEELQKLLKPKIMLPSGGYLILEHTEALTVIDVNTGKFTGGRNLEDTIVRTNIEAAAEIARQVRLRDIGGIIVVDFIDMAHERSRQQVIETLTEALRRDRTRSTIQVFSNLGLLEFTRKRVGKDLAGQLRSDCPYCAGLGDVMSSESLAIGLLRQIRQRGQNGSRGKKLDLLVDPSVATQLVGWYREEFDKLARELGLEVQLFVEPNRHREAITLESSRRTRRPIVAGREIEADLLPVRLPDPASGVAVFDGNIIEVKDAANASGLTAKIRITSVDGNLARAELAEPLQTGQRRRRRGRGRGKSAVETEAPIAPPTPKRPHLEERVLAARAREREVAPARASEARPAAEHEGRRSRPSRAQGERPASDRSRPEAPSRRHELPPIAYGIDEEDEEDFTLRGGRLAGGSVGAGSAPRRRPSGELAAKRRDGAGSERGGRGRARGRADNRPPQLTTPMIVGGEGDIDYEEDEDSVVVMPGRRTEERQTAPRGASPSAIREGDEDETSTGSRRRRRRRGRGKGTAERGPAARETGSEDYDDDEAVDVVDAGRPRTIVVEPERNRGRAARPEREPREERPSRRPAQRHYGPIQQLYGRPMEIERDEREERSEREERRPRREPPSRDDRKHRDERCSVRDTFDQDEDLDMVVEPAEPGVLDVQLETGHVHRERSPRFGREERRDRIEREDRRPRRDEERERGEPRRSGGRFGRGRERNAQAEPRVSRPVKQLYPPPGAEEAPPPADAPKPMPFASRRTPRGPMMRDPKSEPPPKGKVRQLYPPPQFDEEYVDEQSIPAPVGSEPEREPARSMFVSDAAELEERRRLARERADTRERDQSSTDSDSDSAETHKARSPLRGPFEDDEEE
jgi:ribonuclease G